MSSFLLNTASIINYRLLTKTYRLFVRRKSGLSLWQEDLNTDIKISIEQHWRNEVVLETKHDFKRDTVYVLSMFPYPSGNLHLGHVRVYSISDTIARFHKMNGKEVIHPMGWDAFGLPAENAAIENKILPQHWTTENIKNMKQQLNQLGFSFDWSREISTCHPDYYKWTQYIFLKLLENGLAYRSKALVNWDPIDETVLADEQVDAEGCSWRSGAKVIKVPLNQWFIKTTKFAEKLYIGLSNDELENWKDIINLQEHWIGVCDGINVKFKLRSEKELYLDSVDVWTSQPEKFVHCQFLTISSKHLLTQCFEIKGADVKLPILATNPITNEDIPIYITDKVEYPDGRDIYIASTLCSQEDKLLAKLLGVPQTSGEKILNVEADSNKAIVSALEKDVGGYKVSSKLKDWLISRQRYWGTPIPIVYCPACGTVPVPFSELPIKLPNSNSIDNQSSGKHSLASCKDWVNCKCPKCHSDARRETDTMDTFVDSSWYFLRYLDPHNADAPFEKTYHNRGALVDIYIGGKEHAVLHLYYARFMSYFLHHIGWVEKPEPFKRLLVQGMIMGKSYRTKSTGKYLAACEVEIKEGEISAKTTGEPVEVQWEKMSKSKYNGESPQQLLSMFGCDTTRLLLLADVPPATSRMWSDATFPGVLNWQRRLWLTIREFLLHRSDEKLIKSKGMDRNELEKYEAKLWEARNHFTAGTTYNFKHTYQLSVGISRMQGLTNSLRNKVPPYVVACCAEYELALACLIIMLAPVAPHFCCELWSGLVMAPNRIQQNNHRIHWDKGVLEQSWPSVDNHFKLSLLCKVDGADRCNLKIPAIEFDKLTHEQALEIMMKEVSVTKRIKEGIIKTEFEMYPGCRSTLHIQTNRHSQNKLKAVN